METETQNHAEGRWSYEDRGRNWHDIATSQGMPRIVGNHKKLGRGKEGFFPRDFRKIMALLTLGFWTSGLQKFEKLTFCSCNPPCLWKFVMEALGN